MQTSPELSERVKQEIEAVHDFLAAWFRGELEPTDAVYGAGLADRLASDFVNIQPAGTLLTRSQLLEPIKAAFGANPDFRISIADVAVRYADMAAGLVLATYVEHQDGARNTTPPANTRISTVLFRVDAPAGPLTWLHIHETAVPAPSA